MQGNIIKKRLMSFALEKIPHVSLSCKLQWATKVLRHFVILEYLRQISLFISTILPPPPFPMLDFRSLEFASFLYNIEKGEGGVGSQYKPDLK